MSDQAPPTPPPPNWQGGDDPRASAKAQKAYAKAQRPWYKKKRFIIPLVILAIIVIASAAGAGGDKGSQKNEASDTPTAASTNSQKETPKADASAKVDNGKAKGAITWGNWEVVGKLQVSKEDFTGSFAVVTRVRNTGDDADEGYFTVTILKGEQVLGTATCYTSTVQPGAIGTAKCSSTDDFKPGYTEVTIEDAF
jgi:hypothetical protein